MSELIPHLGDALEVLRANRPSSRIQREARREIECEVAAGEVEVARVRRRARVTQVALASTAVLSNEEAHYIHVAPLGEARYKALIDTFTIAVANEVGRP